MGHRGGESREQAVLFPVMLDELIEEDSMARVIDAWVSALDLRVLGFGKAQAARLGRPPYDPADLLRLYLCGYLNGIRSSRALERECRRNVECMWLLGRLVPGHKTIADFRRHNSGALVASCAGFVQFVRREGLVGGTVVAIDGSKVQAVASRKAVGKAADLEREQQRLAREVAHYLEQLEAADRQEEHGGPGTGAFRHALKRLRARQDEVAGEVERLANGGATHDGAAAPDSRTPIWHHQAADFAQCPVGIARAKGRARRIASGSDGLQPQARCAYDRKPKTRAGTAGLSPIFYFPKQIAPQKRGNLLRAILQTFYTAW